VGGTKDTQNMVEINRFLDEAEKLSLLPDRFYLVLRPVEDKAGGFDVMAYDTTDPKKPISPSYYVLKGIMEMMDTDLDRLVSLGQMAVMDKMIEIQTKGESPIMENIDDDVVTKVDIGKKH
tara:strand:+ start:1039 stop:1401 length:363 start_codon:yes stop_codon:yes gene_type:complete